MYKLNRNESGWMISDIPWDTEGYLKKYLNSSSVPKSNWRVWNFHQWVIDPTLEVSEGAFIFGSGPVLQQQVDLSKQFDKFKYGFGTFKLTQKMFNGHPVYENTAGAKLFMQNVYWTISTYIGHKGIEGYPARLCPSESTIWEYFAGSEYQPADIHITSI